MVNFDETFFRKTKYGEKAPCLAKAFRKVKNREGVENAPTIMKNPCGVDIYQLVQEMLRVIDAPPVEVAAESIPTIETVVEETAKKPRRIVNG